MSIEISLAIIAVAFVLIFICIGILTYGLCRILSQIKTVITQLQHETEELLPQLRHGIESSTQLILEVKQYTESVAPFARIVSRLGHHLEEWVNSDENSLSCRSISWYASRGVAVEKVIDWLGSGIRLWKMFKTRR